MKNITVLIFSMVLASNTFAYTLKHKHENNLSYISKAKHGDIAEDFSGTWVGDCDKEEFKLSISQDDKQITLVYSEKDFPDFEDTFELNKLITHVNSTSLTNESSAQFASIRGNILQLISHEIFAYFDVVGGGSGGYQTMSAKMIKDGDTLTIDNFPEESCVLHKSN